ncbi:MAG: SDR family NAD(P)-dependent oxidoreductase [Aureispira sp.]|nr:SDR family NAD(P)-dependent oxidoreductase [Aureispira sp.]
MQKHTLYIFFSEANLIEVNQIVKDLKHTNINCIVNKTTAEKVELLTQDKGATGLLLVSDNYLKSIEETNHLDQILDENLSGQLIPIITHGRRLKVGTSEMEVYPTKIQTLNNVMYYRDYWYEEWISLRKKSKKAAEEEQEALDEQKEIAKKMSVGSISNHIRKINSSDSVDWDEFCADGYQMLFDYAELGASSVEETSTNHSEEIPVVEERIVEETVVETIEEETIVETEQVEMPIEAMAPLETVEEEVVESLKVEEDVPEEVVTESVESLAEEEEASEELIQEETVEEEVLTETIESPSELETGEEEPFTMKGMDDLENLDAEAILEEYKIEEVDDVDTLFYIAESNAEEGDFEDARRTYERILKLDPYNGRALIWLARLLARHYEGETMEAAHLYRKSIMVNDENAGLYYEYALLQKEHFKSYNKASDSFREALLIDSMFEDAYLGLAQCQREMGMVDQAKANYLQACVLDAPRFQTAENDNYFGVLRILEEEVDASSAVLELEEEEEIEVVRSPNADTVVMVTGASSGIGQAIAGQFIMAGYKVIITGRRQERLTEFKELMENHLEETHIHSLNFDVCDLDAVKNALNSLPEEWANIDVLINNAGLAKGLASVHEGNVDHWETMINTNIKGLLYMTRMVTPGMVERKKGHIINLGSVAGTQVYPGGGVYSATKAAVDSLTRSMRLDLHQHNIKVTCVSPGHVESTEFAAVRYEDKEKAKIYEDFKPLSARDVAETVYYVATRPDHVNIQDILMFGTQQASVRDIDRSGRGED